MFKKKYIFLFILLLPLNLSADIGETFGFSASGIAKGNAVTASVNDWSSVFYNIAGLGKTPQKDNSYHIDNKGLNNLFNRDTSTKNEYYDQMAIGYLYFYPKMNIDIAREVWDEDNAAGPDENLTGGSIVIGVVYDLNRIVKMPNFISSARFGLGLSSNLYIKRVYNADGSSSIVLDKTVAKVNDLDDRTHNYIRYGRNIQRTLVNVGSGFGFLNDMVGVGGGITVFGNASGSMIMRNPSITSDVTYPEQEISAKVSAHMSPIGGLYINADDILAKYWKKIPVDDLQVALSYRGEMYMEVAPMQAMAQMDIYTISMFQSARMFSFYTPQVVNTGISAEFYNFTVEFDLGVELWSLRQIPDAREKQWADRKEMQAANASEEIRKLYDIPEFNDVYIPKISISYNLNNNLTLMTGYYYQPTMLGEDSLNGFFNYMDNNKHVVSLGAKWKQEPFWIFTNAIEFSLGVQGQILTVQTANKLPEACTKTTAGVNAAVNKNISYSYSGFVVSSMFDVIFHW